MSISSTEASPPPPAPLPVSTPCASSGEQSSSSEFLIKPGPSPSIPDPVPVAVAVVEGEPVWLSDTSGVRSHRHRVDELLSISARLGQPRRENVWVRDEASKALARLVEKQGGPVVIATLIFFCLEDTGIDVRVGTLTALAQVAKKVGGAPGRWKSHPSDGGAKVVAAVSARLKDESFLVRAEALRVLPQLVEKAPWCPSAGTMITAVSALLKDDFGEVRELAILTLARLAKKGDAGVIEAVLARLKDGCPVVSMAAVQALAQLAEKGSVEVITAAVLAFLRLSPASPSPDIFAPINIEAIKTLVHLAPEKRSAEVIPAVLARLTVLKELKGEDYAPARADAIKALAQIAEEDDAGVIAAISASLEVGAGVCVRVEAIRALAQLAEKRKAEAIRAIQASLSTTTPDDVVSEATQALMTLSSKP